jgi:putative transposase
MSDYRRFYQKGGLYFFTVVTYKRQPILTHPEKIERLRNSFGHVMKSHPFAIDAIVIISDHLHCIWRLYPNDHDFSTRWRLIKRYFSIGMTSSLTRRKEKKIWQRRYWEHLIRNEEDWRRHIDYIHYNPVRHGLVERPGDWKYGSFKRAVEKGWYDNDWGESEPESIRGLERE